MCAHAASPTPDLILDAIRARLRNQYRLHRCGALFWTAYQGMQLELWCATIHATTSVCATRWRTSLKTWAWSNTRNGSVIATLFPHCDDTASTGDQATLRFPPFHVHLNRLDRHAH